MNDPRDPYAPPPPDLQGWYLVDALDGRRWVGRWQPLVEIDEQLPPLFRVPLLADEDVFWPALEVPPDRVFTTVPGQTTEMNPATMTLEQRSAAVPMQFSMFNIEPLVGPKCGAVPARIRRASLARESAS